MSEATQQQSQPQKLTAAQKETAQRLGMSEKEYGDKTAELIKRGRINPEHLK